MNIYTIVRLSDNAIIWVGESTPQDIERRAMIAAVNGHGNVQIREGLVTA